MVYTRASVRSTSQVGELKGAGKRVVKVTPRQIRYHKRNGQMDRKVEKRRVSRRKMERKQKVETEVTVTPEQLNPLAEGDDEEETDFLQSQDNSCLGILGGFEGGDSSQTGSEDNSESFQRQQVVPFKVGIKRVSARVSEDDRLANELMEKKQASCTGLLMTGAEQKSCDEQTNDSTTEEDQETTQPVSEVVEEEEEDYETQRQRRMEENMRVLQDLGIHNIMQTQRVESEVRKRIIRAKQSEQAKLRRSVRRKFEQQVQEPLKRRKSPRLRKTKRVKYDRYSAPTNTAVADLDSEYEGGESEDETELDLLHVAIRKIRTRRERRSKRVSALDPLDSDYDEELAEKERQELAFINKLEDRLYTCEEYFTLKGVKPQFIQERGAFSGWVEDGLRESLRIAEDKETAWESNGGGKFSFRTPGGHMTKLLKNESAKEVARKMLHKNPNSYFYRHCAPGVEHWQGDWTEPENELFLEVAKEHGVGNKWGLFATYVPHRVGYQCSNHYRAHFVEGGVVWDGNFMLDRYGKSFYVGRKNKYL